MAASGPTVNPDKGCASTGHEVPHIKAFLGVESIWCKKGGEPWGLWVRRLLPEHTMAKLAHGFCKVLGLLQGANALRPRNETTGCGA